MKKKRRFAGYDPTETVLELPPSLLDQSDFDPSELSLPAALRDRVLVDAPRTVSIPHVAWRNGRPRFAPSDTLRNAGFKGHDLKNADGAWMTEGQALDWSRAFSRKVEATRQKAKAKRARAKKQAVAAVVAAIPAAPVARSYTLGQLLEQWLRDGTGHNKPGTLKTYRAAVRAIAAACPEHYYSEAAAMRRREIRDIHRLVVEARSDSVGHMAVVVLSTAYNWALDDDDLAELLDGNPVNRIKTKKAGKRERAASVTEFLHLLATAERLGEHAVADMLAWGVWTAQRAGDRLAMAWANLRDSRLEITQQKTGAKVSVPLSAALSLRLPAPDRIPNRPRIIDIDVDDGAQRLHHYWRHLHKVIDEAAKTMPSVADLLDRDLRRTASSWMGRAGCTIPEIYSITGHKFARETAIMGHYMAIDLAIADNAIAKLEAWYTAELAKIEQLKKRRVG